MTYTAVQIKALAAALALATEAIQEMGKTQLPLSVPYVLDAEASLFRAQAALAAILEGIENPVDEEPKGDTPRPPSGNR